MTQTSAPRKSDLAVRTASAAVMLAVAGGALWLGGWIFTALVVAVGVGVLWEWWNLTQRIAPGAAGRTVWLAAGALYIGVAMTMLVALRQDGIEAALAPVALVIGVDVCAYFAGRTIGGPRLAPAISPNKTWAGLLGGVAGAWLVGMLLINREIILLLGESAMARANLAGAALAGLGMAAIVAVVAQAGDLLESWMKRRAGVKDSGALIPGHGGLFDRVDGLIALLAAMAMLGLFTGGLHA